MEKQRMTKIREYLNEKLDAGEGIQKEINDGGSHLYYEVVKATKIVYLHDLYVAGKDRGQGKGTTLVNQMIKDYKGYTVWVGAISKGMQKVAEKLGFEKVSGKSFRGMTIPKDELPKGVKYANAVIYRKKI